MRLALAQLNPVVGDLAGNGARILAACRRAATEGADLVLTPELSLWGYPPRDLLLLPARLEAQSQALDGLAAALAAAPGTPAVLVGVAEACGERCLPNLHNALALVEAGGWRVVARKQLLPSYDVFDERRYFRPASAPALLELECRGRSWRLGLTICEDLWVEEELQGQRLVGPDPIAALQPLQPDLLLNLSASPFSQAKGSLRRQLASRAAGRLGCPVVYVNQVGGNDELVFDGASFVVDAHGALLCRLPCCQEAVTLWDAAASPGPGRGGQPGPGTGAPGATVPRAGAGGARLRRHLRLPAGPAGAEWRHRFGPGGGDCGRRPGGNRVRALLLPSPGVRPAPSTMPWPWRAGSACAPTPCRSPP